MCKIFEVRNSSFSFVPKMPKSMKPPAQVLHAIGQQTITKFKNNFFSNSKILTKTAILVKTT